MILSSFSWGYVTTQLVGGRMTEKYGIKKIYGICLFLCGILTAISPPVAKLHYMAFVALRILQGVLEGVTFPSLHAMTARWVPVEERNSFIARSYFGSVFGMIITLPMCGAIVKVWGWEVAFYVIAVINTIWFICWWLLVFDTPEQHPRISEHELLHIQDSLKESVDSKHSLPVPWKAIFTSIPFWALIIGDMGNCWGIITMASNMPTYLKLMVGMDITTTGILSSLPMLCRYIGGLIHGYIADWLLLHKKLSRVNVRRLFNSISQCIPALTMTLTAFSGCNVTYAVVLQCIGFFFNGAISCGHFSSYIDLAPNFSGTLFGIGNTFSGGGTGFLAPLVIGAITQDNMTFAAWRTVFLLTAGIYFGANIIYVIFIQGEIQVWNYPPDTAKRGKSGEIPEHEEKA